MSTEKAGVLSTTSPAPDPPGLQFDGFEISPENVVSDSRVDWSEAKSWLSSVGRVIQCHLAGLLTECRSTRKKRITL